ncbi:hypothetical protein ACRAWF_09160 [Streptomyces sp. L7]
MAAGAALTPVVFAATDSGSGSTPDATPSSTKPETFPATRTATATGTAPATTAFAASYVGLRWTGEQDGAGIRLADGPWQPTGTGCATVDGGGTALIAADEATTYEVKTTAERDGRTLRGHRLHPRPRPHLPRTVRADPRPRRPLPLAPGLGRRRVEAVQGRQGQHPRGVLPVAVDHGPPHGHTERRPGPGRDRPGHLRVPRGHPRLGRHRLPLLIDEAGVVYEGRYLRRRPDPRLRQGRQPRHRLPHGGLQLRQPGHRPHRQPRVPSPRRTRQGLPDPPDQGHRPLQGPRPPGEDHLHQPGERREEGQRDDQRPPGLAPDGLPGPKTMYDLLSEVRAAAAR